MCLKLGITSVLPSVCYCLVTRQRCNSPSDGDAGSLGSLYTSGMCLTLQLVDEVESDSEVW